MKKQSCLLLLVVFTICLTRQAEAQILNKIKKRVTETAENKALDKSAEATEKAINDAEEGVKGKKKERDSNPVAGVNTGDDPKAVAASATTGDAVLSAYANYDFVPGEKIIYYYDMADETDTEISGRMLINSGGAEIQTFRGEKVLLVPKGAAVAMKPLMKAETYLPEHFTFEFDILSNGGVETTTDVSDITIYFREPGNNDGYATAPDKVTLSGVSADESGAYYILESYHKDKDKWLGTGSRRFPGAAVNSVQNNWRHAAIYVNKNIAKLYLDQHRLGVVNQLDQGQASSIEIEVTNSEHPVLFRNFRLAAGGADTYKKVMTDGKFIAHGIQFDVNKATLKPESMGTINELVRMMKEKPELKFEIGGHTDNDGTAGRNNILSQERADAVKKRMVSMGIDAGRLTAKGYGFSKPVTENNTPEHKAKNRRVELIKK